VPGYRISLEIGLDLSLRQAIDAALEHGLSQGLIESTNTKIRLITRIAFGFRSPESLIALAMLALGGHRPRPTRPTQTRTDQSVEPGIFTIFDVRICAGAYASHRRVGPRHGNTET